MHFFASTTFLLAVSALAFLTIGGNITEAALQDSLVQGAATLAAPLQREIQKHIDTQKQFISRLLGIDADTTFSSLFPAIGKLNITQLRDCYNPGIGKEEFNLFDGTSTVFNSLKMYYVRE